MDIASHKSVFLIFIFYIILATVQGGEEKLDKNAKFSEIKHRLLKEHESLSSPETSTSIHIEEGFENEPISVLGISVPPEFENDTVKEDHHIYFNSTFYTAPDQAKHFWVDMDSPSSHSNTHEMLSTSYRQATTVELSFEFPFYGHLMKNITIATGGFLYMGDYLHNWIAATQYIAPLMANFDTSHSPQSLIKYADNGTAFTVQWENVFIQDRMKDGGFTFQSTLHKNGDIVFAYKDIPYPVANISDSRHPVKIGISDAYILERSMFFVRRKTIYEYHRIDMLSKTISNNTAFYFVALPTCNGYNTCTSCIAADAKLECRWCEAVKRCSDGIDRSRQTWITGGCPINKQDTCSTTSVSTSTDRSFNKVQESTSNELKVPISTDVSTKSSTYNIRPSPGDNGLSKNEILNQAHYMQAEASSSSGISTGAIITIVLFIMALIAAGLWVGYAYKFPQTPSGQFLIKYRPTQWTVKSRDSDNSNASRHT